MSPRDCLDQKNIEALADKLAQQIRDFYADADPGRPAVFEVLSALGIVAGNVLAGTGASPLAIEFFFDTVYGQTERNLTNEEGGGHA